MTRGAVTVVGGVYAEVVRSPPRYELFGSGGRGAAVLSALGCEVELLTAIDTKTRELFEPMATGFRFVLRATDVPITTQFVYEHPLGAPRTRPLLIPQLSPGALTVQADDVLLFGMLEGTPRVTGRRIVYDPQDPLSPKWLDDTDSRAAQVTYVLNLTEGRLLTGQEAPHAIVASVLAKPNVSACALKLGPRGALVGDRKGQVEHIPCYRTERVWPVGSGDIFAGAVAWGIFQDQTIFTSASAASRAVALYANSQAIPSQADLLTGDSFPFEEVQIKDLSTRPRIYLGGPFFTIQDHWLVEEARSILQGMGLQVFSPLHDVGEGNAEQVAPRDLQAIRDSSLVFALLESLDPGTLFEVGFARALDRPVIAYVGQVPEGHLKMVTGSGCKTERDLTTALYEAAWNALEI
ncbi:MAG TPA: PfkB family carbohydrate kinase [Thermoanaerobaculia bacterium]|jgi:hypothetical protein|nr:PfkB family carbohydrate kinase [Thermoanaerobaculia bacterium]